MLRTKKSILLFAWTSDSSDTVSHLDLSLSSQWWSWTQTKTSSFHHVVQTNQFIKPFKSTTPATPQCTTRSWKIPPWPSRPIQALVSYKARASASSALNSILNHPETTISVHIWFTITTLQTFKKSIWLVTATNQLYKSATTRSSSSHLPTLEFRQNNRSLSKMIQEYHLSTNGKFQKNTRMKSDSTLKRPFYSQMKNARLLPHSRPWRKKIIILMFQFMPKTYTTTWRILSASLPQDLVLLARTQLNPKPQRLLKSTFWKLSVVEVMASSKFSHKTLISEPSLSDLTKPCKPQFTTEATATFS